MGRLQDKRRAGQTKQIAKTRASPIPAQALPHDVHIIMILHWVNKHALAQAAQPKS
jgi:hypothetical protein